MARTSGVQIYMERGNGHTVRTVRLPLQPTIVPAGHWLVVNENVVVVTALENLCEKCKINSAHR